MVSSKAKVGVAVVFRRQVRDGIHAQNIWPEKTRCLALKGGSSLIVVVLDEHSMSCLAKIIPCLPGNLLTGRLLIRLIQINLHRCEMAIKALIGKMFKGKIYRTVLACKFGIS